MYKKYVVVEGNAYSRGVQIGKELKNQISINYQNQTKYYRDKEDFNYRKWGDQMGIFVINIDDEHLGVVTDYLNQKGIKWRELSGEQGETEVNE